MKLDSRIALVTGGARRVGRALSLALAHDGARVAIHYGHSADDARDTVAEIERSGGQARAFPADLRQPDAPTKLVETVAREMGGLDVLVNSAAIMVRTPIGEVTPDVWDEMMAINLRAPFFASQAAAAVMPDGGVIVNIADIAGIETWRGYVPHGISKAGVIQMTRALASALAPRIRVNAVAPGVVLLPEGTKQAVADHFVATTPLQRLGSPADVVEAVRYLISADFVTGHTIVADGGRHVRR